MRGENNNRKSCPTYLHYPEVCPIGAINFLFYARISLYLPPICSYLLSIYPDGA